MEQVHVSMFRGKSGRFDTDVLDTLGSSMRGSKVSILAFEVANTIVKGSNLMQSLSEENIQIFKNEILYSEGVQLLVSTDIKELLSIAAADKREEFEVFLRDVARFGDLCIDPQWHNLDRYFLRLHLDPPVTKKGFRNELYLELHALEKYEQLYQCKRDEVKSLDLPLEESLVILFSELKSHTKLVTNLKKKSLWSKSVEENSKKVNKKSESLGVSGLALHYANLITQMDTIASRAICVPPKMRDKLYAGLPASVKADLRSRLQALDSKEVMAVPQIKAEMEKVLHWLIPIATNTIKNVFEYSPLGQDMRTKHDSVVLRLTGANRANEFGKKTSTSNNIIRLQTSYHPVKQKMDRYILDLVIYLHRLISLVRYRDKIPKYTSARSPNSNGPNWAGISSEDKNLLEEETKRRTVVTISKSQELETVKNWTC